MKGNIVLDCEIVLALPRPDDWVEGEELTNEDNILAKPAKMRISKIKEIERQKDVRYDIDDGPRFEVMNTKSREDKQILYLTSVDTGYVYKVIQCSLQLNDTFELSRFPWDKQVNCIYIYMHELIITLLFLSKKNPPLRDDNVFSLIVCSYFFCAN